MSFAFLQRRLDQCDPRALYPKFEQSLKGAVAIDIVAVNNNSLWKDTRRVSILEYFQSPVESNLGQPTFTFQIVRQLVDLLEADSCFNIVIDSQTIPRCLVFQKFSAQQE